MGDGIVQLLMTAWSGVATEATWAAYDETGAVIGTATGDATALTQQAISYAIKNGLPFQARGRTYNAAGIVPFLMLSSTIAIPPNVCQLILFDSVAILSRPSDGGPGLVFDSFEDLTFEQRGGQFLYTGGAAAVRFAPENVTPVDGTIATNLGKIKFEAITVQGAAGGPGASNAGPCAVEFDPTQGSIWAGQYNFGEVDGVGHCAQTMRVLNPAAATFFENNQIGGAMVVNSTSAAIQIGMNQANQANIRHNIHRWGSIQPGNAASDGFNTFGSCDRIEVGVVGSDNMAPGLNRGFVFEPGSVANRYTYGQIVIAGGGAIVDAGTGNIRF